jgi:hypothetical protein
MNDFEVQLSPRAWRVGERLDPESGPAFGAVKASFWKRNMGWGKDLVHVPESPDPMPLSTKIATRMEATATVAKPMREGHPDTDYDVGLLGTMEEKTPQFNLRNVPRYIMEGDHEEIEWARSKLGDKNAYRKDLEEVRAAKHVPPTLEMAYAGSVLHDEVTKNHEVFKDLDWEQWLGQEHKKNSSGRLWEHKPADGGKRTRPWPKIRITEHKFWKGRLITENY